MSTHALHALHALDALFTFRALPFNQDVISLTTWPEFNDVIDLLMVLV